MQSLDFDTADLAKKVAAHILCFMVDVLYILDANKLFIALIKNTFSSIQQQLRCFVFLRPFSVNPRDGRDV